MCASRKFSLHLFHRFVFQTGVVRVKEGKKKERKEQQDFGTEQLVERGRLARQKNIY